MSISRLSSEGQNRSLWPYYFFDLLSGIHFSSAIIIPFFISWGGLSYAQIFSLQSWYLFWAFLLEVPTGIIADRYGKKLSLIFGAIIGAVGLFLIGSFSNILIFFVAEFLAALSVALISGAFEAILYESSVASDSPEDSKKIFGKSYAFRMAGTLIAAPIGAVTAARSGLNIPILMDAAALLGALCMTIFMKESKNIDNKLAVIESQLSIIKKGFNFLCKHQAAKDIILQMITIGVAGYYITWLYQPLLRYLHVSLEYFGWFSILLVGSQIIIASNFRIIEKIVPSTERYTFFSILSLVMGFSIFIKFPSLQSLVLFILLGSHSNAQIRYISAHINQWIPNSQRATVLSVLNMIQNLFIVLINPMVGFFVDHSVQRGLLVVLFFLVVFLCGVKLVSKICIDKNG